MSGIWCDTVFGRLAVCSVSIEFWIDPDDYGRHVVRGSVWAPDASGYAGEVKTARRLAPASAEVGDVAAVVLIDLGLGGQLDVGALDRFVFGDSSVLLRWDCGVPMLPAAVIS